MIKGTTKKPNKKNDRDLISRLKWWLGFVFHLVGVYISFVVFSVVTWYYYVPYLEVFYLWLHLGIATAGYLVGITIFLVDYALGITAKREQEARREWAKERERRRRLKIGKPPESGGHIMFG